nr:hypothetical protein Hi04_10k_c1170_00013 [uncultured bacterium]
MFAFRPIDGKSNEPLSGPVWNPFVRFAFRFGFVYLGLYCLFSQVIVSVLLAPKTIPGPGLGTHWPFFQATSWAAVHIFGIKDALVYTGNSRDTTFFWAQAFVLLVAATMITVLWSVVDRRHKNYVSLHKWFRVFMRFALAAQMFYFGMTKIIPTQFPAPSLLTLVAPVGNLSLQSMLWTSIGASAGYQIFTGLVEVAGGLLLLVPRTTTIGALICLASMFHVFILNMTYDLGVKLLSFTLVLMSLFLLMPDFRRLGNFFLFNRSAGVSTEPTLFDNARANRIAVAVQIVFGVYLLAMYADIGRTYWYLDGAGSPKSALYGIWNVEEMAIDGAVRPPELNDYDRRWRRVIFESPQWIFFQRTDDSFVRYGVTIDSNKLALTKGRSQTWQSSFTFQRPSPDRLLLDGQMDGHTINLKLQLLEFDTFRLLNSPFRWARPPDPDTER